MVDRLFAKEFRRIEIEIKGARPAFHMYLAVWSNPGRGECLIGAPTLEALARRWAEVTQRPLDASRAQYVLVMNYDAPGTLVEPAHPMSARGPQ
jgi:hypothetical protein